MNMEEWEKNEYSEDFSLPSGGIIKNISIFASKNLGNRQYMEDRAFFDNDKKEYTEDEYLLAVLDGHGGSDVVNYCTQLMPSKFRKKYKPYKTNLPGIFTTIFQELDEDLKNDNKTESGSTCCVCFIRREKDKHICYLANMGDTRAVLVSKDEYSKFKAEIKTVDHKGSNQKEQERIQQSGGSIIQNRVSGSLAVTRALGDLDLKKEGVINIPDVSYFPLASNDKYLIIATDGLWDVLDNEILIDEINLWTKASKSPDIKILAEQLVKSALKAGTKDNTTCMVVEINIEK